jgi:hypothetical protein
MFRKLFQLLLSGLICLPVWAGTPVYTGFFSATAIKGYDPVAYFTEQAAIPGDDNFRYRWNDVDWHFSSAQHRELFAASPEQYAPQYGGYCAYAIAAKNALVKVDPRVWTIVEGKLYLNYSQKVQSLWDAKQADSIRSGDLNWTGHLK